MRLREIILDDQKQAVSSNLGKEVILNDEHRLWQHGILQEDGHPQITYKLELLDREETLILHYHDLLVLLERYGE